MRKVNKADLKRTQLRNQLWPGSEEWIWDFSDKEKVIGFATVPRLLPLVIHLIQQLVSGEKGGDPTPVYLELWCRDFGQGYVSVTDEAECAYASGYASRRAVRTWRGHMERLNELGFIKVQPDGNREYGNVLLLNPLAVCHRIHQDGKTPEGWWSAFTKRASTIGALIPQPLVFPPTSSPVPPAMSAEQSATA